MASKRFARAEPPRSRAGFTLIELVVSVGIAALLMASLSNTVLTTLSARDLATERNARIEEARFVLDRMTRAVQAAELIFVPRPDDPGTAQIESIRDPGVLAISMDSTLDRDRDGIADADNDGDGLVDEDPTGDLQGDFEPGVIGIDDDLDGEIDEGDVEDDDEDGQKDEDDWNGIDDDGDGWIDEDPKEDLSGDGEPGDENVDDDGDGSVDEGDQADDDEDGLVDEDWFDTVVFRLVGSDLIERTPALWDVDATASVNGADFVEQVIAEGVSEFRVEYLRASTATGAPLVDLSISLATASGAPVKLGTIVQLGSAR